jgi:RNA polymerase sigma-70 factor (ECF subfamily)
VIGPAPEPSDDELIASVVDRDHAALMALYDRHGRLAFALAYRVLGDAQGAEEAVQDAFLQVWRRAETFDRERGFGGRAWLLAIVRNRAIDGIRRRSGRARETTPLEDVEATTPTSAPGPWAEVSAALERDRVRAAVAELPREQQDAIRLAYFDGLSHGEIADRTGLPLGTVKGRVRLGLRKLAGLLAEPGGPSP